jgi:hypothetical protein
VVVVLTLTMAQVAVAEAQVAQVLMVQSALQGLAADPRYKARQREIH